MRAGCSSEFLSNYPQARAFAALDHATNQAHNTLESFCTHRNGSLKGKKVVIIGAGVSGLTAAYELSKAGACVTVLEAQARTGGRCLSLRKGDKVHEDKTADLYSEPSEHEQIVDFHHEGGDSEPYLNAGPGRIPSTHTYLLHYLRKFSVDIEVYVMQSGSNLTKVRNGPLGCEAIVNRRYMHNARGWLSQLVYENAEKLLESEERPEPQDNDMVVALREFVRKFGDLTSDGKYLVSANNPGEHANESGSNRAGYLSLPGARPGIIAPTLPLKDILASEFWKTGIYMHDDILWQPTLFQPVGGMDRVKEVFQMEASKNNATIRTRAAVKSITYNNEAKKYTISWSDEQSNTNGETRADYVLCNAAIPFLERIVDRDLLKGFDKEFRNGLLDVFKTQAKRKPTERFLSNTTKVGWQALRSAWQSKGLTVVNNCSDGPVIRNEDSQLGVVPIYGGISWTSHAITQIWYPSNAYNDKYGVLTGCYNFSHEAVEYGNLDPEKRLIAAKIGAQGFGKKFSESLEHGVAIAWQNMPFIKGGWAQWSHVGEDSVKHFNRLQQGSGVNGSPPTFFIIGDQMSTLPGWLEGAISAALSAISRIVRPEKLLPHYKSLPDPRVIVEGMCF